MILVYFSRIVLKSIPSPLLIYLNILNYQWIMDPSPVHLNSFTTTTFMLFQWHLLTKITNENMHNTPLESLDVHTTHIQTKYQE